MVESVKINGENYFRIENVDSIRPFSMSIVSASNHWMFIGSNGGVTAGRRNAELSLFPYYTDDKIIESAEITGSKTIVKITSESELTVWEPFSVLSKGKFTIKRNLYKNEWGNKILFEEINETLGLVFKYQWNTSNLYGFVRTATLENIGDSNREIEFVDGIQNLVPFGVTSDIQNQRSNLVDAYKRSELDPKSGLGIYALTAIIVDKAEPSEALKANIVWSMGLENPTYLVSSQQLNTFRHGGSINQEEDVKAEKGAYFVSKKIELAAGSSNSWYIVANVNQNHAGVANVIHQITADNEFLNKIMADVEDGTQELIKLTSSSDGLQKTADPLKDARHFSNTMFNIMRGGIFDNNYQIEKRDFEKYLETANKELYLKTKDALEQLPMVFSVFDLQKVVQETENTSFQRLATEYLPLKFSRRHGDPSRPWNKFSINTVNEDTGEKILDYEGNWRDIFQNWEALAWSYPAFIESMIYRFLNASTFDGYNPYRITKDGFDWEIIEPEDPWSYIGYWGDHQIIYLLKFLEFVEQYQPGKLAELFKQNTFVYAAVPYRIKGYDDILKNTKDTIEFDHAWDNKIRTLRDELGSDGALLRDSKDQIYHVNFLEKILATTLAKVSNLIPEAGIWMNTQRPEWNDANNALVGNGVSMVTLYYLRRFLTFFRGVFEDGDEAVEISSELFDFFNATDNALKQFKGNLDGPFSDEDRKQLMDLLGKASTDYRNAIYENGFSGEKESLSMPNLKSFIKVANKFMEHAIEANKREDNLYHGYNIIEINEHTAKIGYLYDQLEGQVGVLSSGYLQPEQVVDLLDGLRNSQLYRADQNSYVLYPFKNLNGFLQKNQVEESAIEKSKLLQKMVGDNNVLIVEKDVLGKYHFHGSLRNAFELDTALDRLDESYTHLVEEERTLVHEIYEEVFNHKEFTGRSTTFYGYEGLGSIYWHMVSKLLLAVEECCHQAIEAGASQDVLDRLNGHFHEIFEGIGVHKSPEVYGAYSVDPYSHTPYWKGAQQPGMTGQVKEDILARFGEIGITMENGLIRFNPRLLNWDTEMLKEATNFHYYDVKGQSQTLELEANTMAFTYCQVPVIYKRGEQKMEIHHADGNFETVEGLACNEIQTNAILNRTGEVVKLVVFV